MQQVREVQQQNPVGGGGWPAPYLEFLARYRAGAHWSAHEVLEDLWRATEEPQRRLFYQGLIQLAAAMVHAERGNLRGVQGLLAKAAAKLRAVAQPAGAQPAGAQPAGAGAGAARGAVCTYQGLDLVRLLQEMEAAAGAVRVASAAVPPGAFDWRRKPRLELPEARAGGSDR